MTVRGKPGKPTPGFPPFPPPLEIAPRFPHSHRFDDFFLYQSEAKQPPLRFNNLGWAKLNRRNGPSALAKRTRLIYRTARAEETSRTITTLFDGLGIRVLHRSHVDAAGTCARKVVALPEDEQEAIASLILASLADEAAWKKRFAEKRDGIRRMAREAVEEHARGETRPLDELL